MVQATSHLLLSSLQCSKLPQLTSPFFPFMLLQVRLKWYTGVFSVRNTCRLNRCLPLITAKQFIERNAMNTIIFQTFSTGPAHVCSENVWNPLTVGWHSIGQSKCRLLPSAGEWSLKDFMGFFLLSSLLVLGKQLLLIIIIRTRSDFEKRLTIKIAIKHFLKPF